MRTIHTLAVVLGLLLSMTEVSLSAERRPAQTRHSATQNHGIVEPANPDALQTQDLGTGLTLQDIVAALVGVPSIAISNVQFTGSDSSLGTFTGGDGIIGFNQGIVLSSGQVSNVVGPNTEDSRSWSYNRPGDPDLDSLIEGFQTTEDACILEFDFECPAVREIGFEYVFSSEEYNEFVNASFNDVFGFFVNGENVALLPDGQTIVSINNVNGGNPLGDSASNPQYYRNNDECQFSTVPSCPVNTEMDGLTVVLIAEAKINPGVNHIKLAVADVGDDAYDSNVFLKGQSFVCGAVNNTAPVCAITPSGPLTVTAGNNIAFTVSGTDADTGQSIYLSVLFSIPQGATMTPSLPRAGSNTGVSSQFSWTPTQPGTYFANFLLTDSLGGVDSCEAQINVVPAANTAPVCTINPPGPFTVIAGNSVVFTVTGTDSDEGQSIYLYVNGALPPGSSMNPTLPRAGSRTGLTSQFSWTPTQQGNYSASFLLTDSAGGSDTATAQIVVSAPQVNVSPVCVISPPGPFTVNAGNPVTFTVSATDANSGQNIRLSTFGTLLPGAVMNPPVPVFGPWTGVSSQFTWTPTQLGSFLARFSASDSSGGFDSISARINVLEGVAPTVTSVSPTNDVYEVPWNTPIIVEFSETVSQVCDLATAPLACVSVSSQRQATLAPSMTWNGTLLIIRPDQQLWPDDDTISVRLSGEISDLAGNGLDGDSDGTAEGSPIDDYTFRFFTAAGVYPGDANDDGIVDERDVLPIGAHFLRTGPTRDRNFESWSLEVAREWSPREATHADCDGNGVIDSNDVCAILAFFDREVSAKRSTRATEWEALTALDEDVRESIARALLNCDNGQSSARTTLLNALLGQSGADNTIPGSFHLEQNYPNPFNAGTVIAWDMSAPGHIELDIFDVLGRRVRNVIDAEYPAGHHRVNWDGRNDNGAAVASGAYFYQITTVAESKARRMVLIR